MDFYSNLLAIQESIKKIRQYEKEEQRKNITYHIKKLPNELSRNIFSYLSLTPFDKQEFIDYHKNKHPFYKYFVEGSYVNRYYTFVVSFNKNEKSLNYYNGRTRVLDTIYEFSFYTTKHKNKLNKCNTKNRFMYVLIQYYQNKNEIKEKIKEQMTKKDIEQAVKKTNPNSPFVCRMNKYCLERLYKSMFLAQD